MSRAITYALLKREQSSGTDRYLLCPKCGERFSAEPSDYFLLRPDEPIRHCKRNMLLQWRNPPKPIYLDPARVTAVKQTCIPASGITRTGYGPKLATSWLLQLDGRRWQRVYVMQWSNLGTPYVVIAGKKHLLGAYNPAGDLPSPDPRLQPTGPIPLPTRG